MKRILFVDDEVFLLEGLKRMLRIKNEEWNMTFVNSGKEAIELMSKNKYDIIVTDNNMDGMDGLELLARVKEISPQTKRILLSGQSEAEIADKVKESAHIFIAKPFAPDSFISILEKTSEDAV
jgi:YesN/AraC family two-component response regulator